MTWGIFNDEGLVEGDFPDKAAADIRAERWYTEDLAERSIRIREVCPYHDEQERDNCELCLAADEGEEDESEDDE